MRPRLILIAACLASTLAFAAPPPDPNAWTPDQDSVAKVDAMALKFDLPAEFGAITAYARYYGGTVIDGKRVIIGALITPQIRKEDSGTVHIVTSTNIPAFADGGCMFIYLTYDPEAGGITQMRCNFELRPPPPPAKE